MPHLDLTSLGYAFGRLAGAARFASPEIGSVASLAIVAGAWCAYRRDAGAGDVGPAQARTLAAAGLVVPETGGLVTPALPGSPQSPSASLDHGPLCAAAADLDLSLAEIDRILSRRRD